MKKLFYAFAAMAALLSVASCQKEIKNTEDTSAGKYIVKFIAVAPETKTTMNIDGNGVASFSWNSADLENDWEVHQGDKTATDVVADLDNRALVITAEFEGVPSGSNYQAVMNGIINDEQVLSSSSYDTKSEVLIGKATADPGDLLEVPFVFKRMSVVHKITLKGLAEGDVINNLSFASKH